MINEEERIKGVNIKDLILDWTQVRLWDYRKITITKRLKKHDDKVKRIKNF
jgi:hypothetical protein